MWLSGADAVSAWKVAGSNPKVSREISRRCKVPNPELLTILAAYMYVTPDKKNLLNKR